MPYLRVPAKAPTAQEIESWSRPFDPNDQSRYPGPGLADEIKADSK